MARLGGSWPAPIRWATACAVTVATVYGAATRPAPSLLLLHSPSKGSDIPRADDWFCVPEVCAYTRQELAKGIVVDSSMRRMDTSSAAYSLKYPNHPTHQLKRRGLKSSRERVIGAREWLC